MAANFNQYATSYKKQICRSQSFAGTDHGVYLRAKANILKRLVRKRFGTRRKPNALDIGCGLGLMEPYLSGVFSEIVGIDPADQAIAYARQTVHNARFETFDGRTIPFPDESFDVVFAICVMHHVPQPQWSGFVLEMRRALKPGGLAAVFEHNPYNLLTRLAVARCEFDKDATLLSEPRVARIFRENGFESIRKKYLLFLPLAGPIWSFIENAIGLLPMGAQYYVTGTKDVA